jgi:hypothetical protein
LANLTEERILPPKNPLKKGLLGIS